MQRNYKVKIEDKEPLHEDNPFAMLVLKYFDFEADVKITATSYYFSITRPNGLITRTDSTLAGEIHSHKGMVCRWILGPSAIVLLEGIFALTKLDDVKVFYKIIHADPDCFDSFRDAVIDLVKKSDTWYD